MELFKLLGTIAVDNTEANNAIDETGEKGEKTEGKLSKAFSAIGSGAAKAAKVIGTGMMVAGTAVVGLVTKSVASYAEYEQLVGGVETLFKDSASKVMEYAENAYKTAGMSANEYMQTVTSFSASLLQSLDGDTAAAAEYANMAITDMSDNANKMGTSMEMIQNAYNGFSKQNYTMLDNLKLGYGGTKTEMERLLKDAEKLPGALGRKFDISNYSDVVEAIHLVQMNMDISGYSVDQLSDKLKNASLTQAEVEKVAKSMGISYEEATERMKNGSLTVQDATVLLGTTAKEAASTISGSIGMMKASWQNLVTAMSDKDADLTPYMNNLVESVSTVGKNLMPVIETALNGAIQLIEQLVPELVNKIPGFITSIIPSVVSAATSIIDAIVGVIPELVEAITAMLPDVIAGFAALFDGLIKAIPDIISALVAALPKIVKELANGLTSVFTSLCTMLPEIIRPLIDAIPGLIMTVVETIIDALPVLLDGIVTLISELVAMLPEVMPVIVDAIVQVITLLVEQIPVILPEIVNAIISIITMLGEQLPVLIPVLVEGMIQVIKLLTEQLPVIIPMVIEAVIMIVKAIIENLPEILMALIQALPAILKAVWDAIVMVFTNLPEWFGQLFAGAVEIIGMIFSPILDFFVWIWDGICSIFSPVGEWFGDIFSGAWDGICAAFSAVGDFFSSVWESIKAPFIVVADWFKGIFTEAWQGVKDVFSAGGKIFVGIAQSISDIFCDVVNGIIKGINTVIAVPFDGINWALGKIKGVKIVGYKPFKWIKLLDVPQIPYLAEGGVVDEPTPAVFGEDGAEAVVPLENNTGWLKKVAQQLHSFMIDSNIDNGLNNYNSRMLDNAAMMRADVESLKNTLGSILDRLDAHLPDMLDCMERPIPAVIGAEQAADALVDPLNYRFGRLEAMKGRGR